MNGANFVKSALAAEYIATSILEGSDQFYVEKANGDQKRVSFTDLAAGPDLTVAGSKFIKDTRAMAIEVAKLAELEIKSKKKVTDGIKKELEERQAIAQRYIQKSMGYETRYLKLNLKERETIAQRYRQKSMGFGMRSSRSVASGPREISAGVKYFASRPSYACGSSAIPEALWPGAAAALRLHTLELSSHDEPGRGTLLMRTRCRRGRVISGSHSRPGLRGE